MNESFVSYNCLNHKKCYWFSACNKHHKTFSNSFSRSLPSTRKWFSFLENVFFFFRFWKWVLSKKQFPTKQMDSCLCCLQRIIAMRVFPNSASVIELWCSEVIIIMLVSRIFGRTLFAAAKSETYSATAAVTSVARNPLQEFFEADRSIDDDKPVVYGLGLIMFLHFVCWLHLVVIIIHCSWLYVIRYLAVLSIIGNYTHSIACSKVRQWSGPGQARPAPFCLAHGLVS